MPSPSWRRCARSGAISRCNTSSLIAYLSGHGGLDVETTGLALKHRQAVLADVLIAQACLDHDEELVTRDQDFKALAVIAGLRLIPAPGRR
jgi:predicted nucleic acid-binding protein